MATKERKFSTVPLNWKEVYFTNCPMVSANNLDNLIRFGGLYPPIQVHADIRRTRLLGATMVYEGGCMMVRAEDPIFRMQDLKGKKVGL